MLAKRFLAQRHNLDSRLLSESLRR
jgi:hypothetical protein